VSLCWAGSSLFASQNIIQYWLCGIQNFLVFGGVFFLLGFVKVTKWVTENMSGTDI
jgi:hypothetical protein